MRGRAGRKGKDEIGETFICCQKTDLEEVAELMEADIPNVTSSLSPNKRGIERSVLYCYLSFMTADSASAEHCLSLLQQD